MEVCNFIEARTQRPQFFGVVVNVIEAKNLAWQQPDSFVMIKLGREYRITGIQRNTNKPFYNQFYTFDFFLPLNDLLEKRLTVGVHMGSRKSCFFKKLLGSVRMDLGFVWFQKHHQFYHKWAILTHPKRNSPQVQGHLKLDIAILEKGDFIHNPYYIKNTDDIERNLLQPCALGDMTPSIGKYRVSIYSGSNFRSQYKTVLTVNPEFTYFGKISVSVSFAGFQMSTAAVRNVKEVYWNEQFTFTEVYPPMFQLIKICVKINDDVICTRVLLMKDLWNCDLKGFLPSFGPAYVHFYDKDRFYQGSVFLAIKCEQAETPLLPRHKLASVQKHLLSGFHESENFVSTDYVIFGVVFEVAMLKENLCPGKDVVLSISMGTQGTSVIQSEDSFNTTLAMECVPNNEGLFSLKIGKFKPCLFLRTSWPDFRHRFFLSNTIDKMALMMKKSLTSAQKQMCIGNIALAHEQLNKMMEDLLLLCTKNVSLPVGKTTLDRARISSFKALLESIVKSMPAFHWQAPLIEKFHRACNILYRIEQLIEEPQEIFPDVILNLWKSERLVSNFRIPARDLLQADFDNRSGKLSGKLLTLFLKPLKEKTDLEINGKVDIFLWLGPAANIGKCLELIPEGSEDLSKLIELPHYIRYPNQIVFQCRAYIYQGQFELRNSRIDKFSPAVRVIMGSESKTTQVIKNSITPIWDEMLVFNQIVLYRGKNYLQKHPPSVVIELLNRSKGEDKLVGVTNTLPVVRLLTDSNHFSSTKVKMDWHYIYDGYNKQIGEILALFEYFEVSAQNEDLSVLEISRKSPSAHEIPGDKELQLLDVPIMNQLSSKNPFKRDTPVDSKEIGTFRKTSQRAGSAQGAKVDQKLSKKKIPQGKDFPEEKNLEVQKSINNHTSNNSSQIEEKRSVKRHHVRPISDENDKKIKSVLKIWNAKSSKEEKSSRRNTNFVKKDRRSFDDERRKKFKDEFKVLKSKSLERRTSGGSDTHFPGEALLSTSKETSGKPKEPYGLFDVLQKEVKRQKKVTFSKNDPQSKESQSCRKPIWGAEFLAAASLNETHGTDVCRIEKDLQLVHNESYRKPRILQTIFISDLHEKEELQKSDTCRIKHHLLLKKCKNFKNLEEKLKFLETGCSKYKILIGRDSKELKTGNRENIENSGKKKELTKYFNAIFSKDGKQLRGDACEMKGDKSWVSDETKRGGKNISSFLHFDSPKEMKSQSKCCYSVPEALLSLSEKGNETMRKDKFSMSVMRDKIIKDALKFPSSYPAEVKKPLNKVVYFAPEDVSLLSEKKYKEMKRNMSEETAKGDGDFKTMFEITSVDSFQRPINSSEENDVRNKDVCSVSDNVLAASGTFNEKLKTVKLWALDKRIQDCKEFLNGPVAKPPKTLQTPSIAVKSYKPCGIKTIHHQSQIDFLNHRLSHSICGSNVTKFQNKNLFKGKINSKKKLKRPDQFMAPRIKTQKTVISNESNVKWSFEMRKEKIYCNPLCVLTKNDSTSNTIKSPFTARIRSGGSFFEESIKSDSKNENYHSAGSEPVFEKLETDKSLTKDKGTRDIKEFFDWLGGKPSKNLPSTTPIAVKSDKLSDIETMHSQSNVKSNPSRRTTSDLKTVRSITHVDSTQSHLIKNPELTEIFFESNSKSKSRTKNSLPEISQDPVEKAGQENFELSLPLTMNLDKDKVIKMKTMHTKDGLVHPEVGEKERAKFKGKKKSKPDSNSSKIKSGIKSNFSKKKDSTESNPSKRKVSKSNLRKRNSNQKIIRNTTVVNSTDARHLKNPDLSELSIASKDRSSNSGGNSTPEDNGYQVIRAGQENIESSLPPIAKLVKDKNMKMKTLHTKDGLVHSKVGKSDSSKIKNKNKSFKEKLKLKPKLNSSKRKDASESKKYPKKILKSNQVNFSDSIVLKNPELTELYTKSKDKLISRDNGFLPEADENKATVADQNNIKLSLPGKIKLADDKVVKMKAFRTKNGIVHPEVGRNGNSKFNTAKNSSKKKSKRSSMLEKLIKTEKRRTKEQNRVKKSKKLKKPTSSSLSSFDTSKKSGPKKVKTKPFLPVARLKGVKDSMFKWSRKSKGYEELKKRKKSKESMKFPGKMSQERLNLEKSRSNKLVNGILHKRMYSNLRSSDTNSSLSENEKGTSLVSDSLSLEESQSSDSLNHKITLMSEDDQRPKKFPLLGRFRGKLKKGIRRKNFHLLSHSESDSPSSESANEDRKLSKLKSITPEYSPRKFPFQRSRSQGVSFARQSRDSKYHTQNYFKSKTPDISGRKSRSHENLVRKNAKIVPAIRGSFNHSSNFFSTEFKEELDRFNDEASSIAPTDSRETSESEVIAVIKNANILRIPHGIRPVLQDNVLEILFWGLRNVKLRLRNPTVSISIADYSVESKQIKSVRSFPNFNQSLSKISIKLPVENLYFPSAVIKLYSHDLLGRKHLKGFYVIKNLSHFKANLIRMEDWNKERNTYKILLNKNQISSSGTEEEAEIEIDPLIVHKESIKYKEEPKTFNIHVYPKIDAALGAIYHFIKDILFSIGHLVSSIDRSLQNFLLYYILRIVFRVLLFYLMLIGSYFSWIYSPFVKLYFNAVDLVEEDDDEEAASEKSSVLEFKEEKGPEDWWASYYQSLALMGDMKKKKLWFEGSKSVFICDCCKDLPSECKSAAGRSRIEAPLMIYNYELEKQPEFQEFQDALKNFTLESVDAFPCIDPKSRITTLFKGAISISPLVPENQLVTAYGNDASLGILSDHFPNNKQSLIVRIYVVRALNLHSQDPNLRADAYINILLGKRKVASNRSEYVAADLHPIFGKCFEVEATFPRDAMLTVQLMDYDKITSDDLIGETTIDLEARFYSKHHGACGLSQAYNSTGPRTWRDSAKPTDILQRMCEKYHALGPTYYHSSVVINSKQFFIDRVQKENTEDIKENLALAVLRRWHELPLIGFCLVPEHVETRSLFRSDKPGVEQGRIEMWVDIFVKEPGITLKPPLNIERRKPLEMQLRVSILNTANVALKDEPFFSDRHSDIYVLGWLLGKVDTQKTDVHYYSLNGDGNFNWRFIFNFYWMPSENMIRVYEEKKRFYHASEYQIPPRLHLQVWDHDKILRDDFIGMLILDLLRVPKPARTRHTCTLETIGKYAPTVNLFTQKKLRGWWPFMDVHKKNKNERVFSGMVEAELELVTLQEANKHPVGYGHDEPNALPPPDRPEIAWNWFTGIFGIFHYFLIPTMWRHKGKILTFVATFAFVYFIVLFIYAFPGYAAKKFVGA